MQKIKISSVSYLNASPFIYGLKNSDVIHEIDLSLDIPAICAKKLLENSVDVGLVPVAILPLLKEYYIVSDYCIGAEGKVASVVLFSKVPLNEINEICLDNQSKTSVALVKILAQNYWGITPAWIAGEEDMEAKINDRTASIIIGDRTFGLDGKYPFSYDLAEEWRKYTGLPFVFACWVANKKLPNAFIGKFNLAMKHGLENRSQLILDLKRENKYFIDIDYYLNSSIRYDFDAPKKQALQLFLTYLKNLQE